MSSWETLKDLVASALELPLAERATFLAQSCRDESMLQEAISLATFGDSIDDSRLLDHRADAFIGLGGSNPAGLTGKQLGKYTLMRLVGQGGMGAVYLARQQGVDRNVAIKVVPPHALMFDARSRFEREIQALGRIDHPGVARVFDSGLHVETSAPGLAPIPYFAMEWIDGLPLTAHVARHALSLRDRVALMIDVADAVNAAHQQAVVHCDLKPANVLVQPPSATHPTGRVKVVDFGLARLMEAGAGNRTATLSSSSVMGTLAYMAPEQTRADQHEIGFRTDVYALGALLHEVIHGVPLLDVTGLTLTEALRRVADPAIPTLKIAGDYSGGDLACVLSVALASDKEQRYSSVEAFADDLRRLQRNEPIIAQPPTAIYKARKFVRRHRVAVLASAGMLFALIIGFATATYGLIRERDARIAANAATAVANSERLKAESARDFLRYIVTSAEPGEGGRNVTVVDAVRAALPEIHKYAAGDAATESDLRMTVAQTFRLLGFGDESLVEYARAHELAVTAHGRDSEQAVSIAIEQAVTLSNNGELSAAERLLAGLPERIERMEDETACLRANAMLGEARANLLSEQGEFKRAAVAYEQLLSQWADVPGLIDDENLETWRMNYALTLSYAGRLRDAENVQREMVRLRTEMRGNDHPQTLIAKQNLAGTLVDLGEFDEARAMLDQVLAIGEVRWGNEHPNMFAVRRSLAALEFARANYRTAADMAALVLEEGRQIYPADSMFLLLTENVLAASLLGDEDWERGLPAMRALVDRLTRLFGYDHPNTLANRASLASALAKSGDKLAAAAELRAVLPLQRAAAGDTAHGTLITQNNLGLLELELGNTGQAHKLVSASLTGAIDTEFQPLVPLCRRNLGRILTATERYKEAEATLITSYEESGKFLNEAEQRKTAQTIIELYTAWGRSDEASRWKSIVGEAD